MANYKLNLPTRSIYHGWISFGQYMVNNEMLWTFLNGSASQVFWETRLWQPSKLGRHSCIWGFSVSALFFLLLRSESLSSRILHWITSVLLPKLQHIFSAWQFKPAKTKHSILFISLLSHELTDNYILQRFWCILHIVFRV